MEGWRQVEIKAWVRKQDEGGLAIANPSLTIKDEAGYEVREGLFEASDVALFIHEMLKDKL